MEGQGLRALRELAQLGKNRRRPLVQNQKEKGAGLRAYQLSPVAVVRSTGRREAGAERWPPSRFRTGTSDSEARRIRAEESRRGGLDLLINRLLFKVRRRRIEGWNGRFDRPSPPLGMRSREGSWSLGLEEKAEKPLAFEPRREGPNSEGGLPVWGVGTRGENSRRSREGFGKKKKKKPWQWQRRGIEGGKTCPLTVACH